MMLFSRRVQLMGPPAEIAAHVTDLRAHVTDVTGREVALWQTGFGAPLGTMTFTMRVEGIADFQELSAKVLADEEYHTKLAAGSQYLAGPAEDSLLEPLNAELGDHPPVGSVALVTTALMANGAYEDALGWSLNMAEHATKVTGIPTLFVMSHYGPFGAVGWIGVAPDAATVDTARAALNGDTEYMKQLGKSGDLFVQGSGLQTLVTRMA